MINLPATNVDDAYLVCDPEESLPVDDPRYIDLTAVRGGDNLPQKVAKRIELATRAKQFHQQLVTGHRGCGKSTELRRLQAKLKNNQFFCVYLDVEDMLDLGEITYQDILLSIARSVMQNFTKAGLQLNAVLLAELEKWFADKVLTEEMRTDLETQIKGTVEAGINVPFLGKLLAALNNQIRSGSSRRTEIRQVLERELSVFIERLNTLLTEAREKAKQTGCKDLVVIIDGLEKMQYRDGTETSNYTQLFVHHAERLKAPHCHLIYTVPIALAFNANLGDAFPDSTFVIPMIKYQTQEGKDALTALIGKRIEIATVFKSPELVDKLIAMSGGAVRDLMRLVRMSCEGGDAQITGQDVERAIRILIREFDRLLRQEDVELLKTVSREKRVTADLDYSRPLSLRLIHEYENGHRWADLHPAVKEVDWLKRELT